MRYNAQLFSLLETQGQHASHVAMYYAGGICSFNKIRSVFQDVILQQLLQYGNVIIRSDRRTLWDSVNAHITAIIKESVYKCYYCRFITCFVFGGASPVGTHYVFCCCASGT